MQYYRSNWHLAPGDKTERPVMPSFEQRRSSVIRSSTAIWAGRPLQIAVGGTETAGSATANGQAASLISLLPARVADSFPGGRVFARSKIKAGFIGVQTAFLGDVVREDLADRHVICMSRMEGAHTPAALDQDDNKALVRWTRLSAFRARNDPELLG